jgi:hypothetical protein
MTKSCHLLESFNSRQSGKANDCPCGPNQRRNTVLVSSGHNISHVHWSLRAPRLNNFTLLVDSSWVRSIGRTRSLLGKDLSTEYCRIHSQDHPRRPPDSVGIGQCDSLYWCLESAERNAVPQVGAVISQ